jgi:hypothetical protein
MDDSYSKRDRYQQRSGENERSNRRKDDELEGRVGGGYRKRPRYEEDRTYARPGNSDSEPLPIAKRVQHNRSSPRDHVRSDSRHYDDRRTSAYLSDRRMGKDAPDKYMYKGHSRGRDGHAQSPYTNRDRISSESNFTRDRERERERKHYRDRSPRSTRRQKLQLSVDGSTSSQKRREVVPYTSSEASSRSREHHSARDESLMKVLSMVGRGFIPSLPEKYYSVSNDQVITKRLNFIPSPYSLYGLSPYCSYDNFLNLTKSY